MTARNRHRHQMAQVDLMRLYVERNSRCGYSPRIADYAMARRGDKAEHRGREECDYSGFCSEEWKQLSASGSS